MYGTSTFHKILSFWQPVYRRKVWQEGQPVCEYCAERKLLQRQMIRFITLKWTKSFCIFDLLRLYFHFSRVWSHFYSQFLQNVKKGKKKKKRLRVPIILVLITDKIKWFWSYNTKKGEKKKKFRVPINLVLITDKIKWIWSYNTRDYHLLFPFLFLIAIYSSYCLLNGVQIFCPTFPVPLYILPIKTCYIFIW